MIEYLNGKLIEKNPAYAVIECNGIGYMVNISLNTFSKIGNSEACKLHTQFIVREDAQLLYGFAENEERELFRLLISVSGVGANTAMLILSSLSPKDVQSAILNEDVNSLKSVKGIGAKSAQRIIVDLKDKIGKGIEVSGNSFSSLGNTKRQEALSALSALGFNRNVAGKALDSIEKQGADLSVEELVKGALKQL